VGITENLSRQFVGKEEDNYHFREMDENRNRGKI
jgi:hypothetical protein